MSKVAAALIVLCGMGLLAIGGWAMGMTDGDPLTGLMISLMGLLALWFATWGLTTHR